MSLALEFLWDCCIESAEVAEKDDEGSGCILAHCMGLGKTLSVCTEILRFGNDWELEIKALQNVLYVLELNPYSWHHIDSHICYNTGHSFCTHCNDEIAIQV